MMPADKVELKNWDRFCKSIEKKRIFPYLYMEGARPNKIFEVCTKEGAKNATDLLLRLKIKNFVLFSVEGCDRCFALMMTAMLVKDLPEARLYVEDQGIYAEGVFPRISSGEIKKADWKGFAENLDKT